MTKKIFTTFGLVFMMVYCAAPPKDEPKTDALEEVKTTAKETMPTYADYMFTDLEGNGVNIEDYLGKRVFVNFWATWCKPCIKEMPDLVETSKIMEKENYVFLFASDESISKISKFQEKWKFDLDFVHFNGDLADLKIYSLPTTFIYDTQGKKRKQIVGAMEWNTPNVLDNLRSVQ